MPTSRHMDNPGDDAPQLHQRCQRPGCSNPAAEPHTCPFSTELAHMSEDPAASAAALCTCCPDCEHECLMDV